MEIQNVPKFFKIASETSFFPSKSWECVLFDNETKIFVAHIRARGYCCKVVTHKNFKRFFLLFSIVQISSWSLRHEQWYGKFQGSKPSFDQEKKNQSSKVTPKILSTIYIMFFLLKKSVIVFTSDLTPQMKNVCKRFCRTNK